MSFTEAQQQWFDGSMLGDGSLELSSKSRNARYKVERWGTDREYLLLEHNIFKEFCSKESIRECQKHDSRTGIFYDSIYFRTLTNDIFTEHHKKWYPEGIKLVPKDLKLNKQLLCSWLMDDGHIELYGIKKNLVKLTFATDDFTKEDVEFLCSLLSERYNGCYFSPIKNGLAKNGRQRYVIKASNSATIELIRDIQELIPECMNRKFTWNGLNLKPVRVSRSLNPIIDEKILYSIIENKQEFTTKDLLPAIIGYAKEKPRSEQIKCIIDYLSKLIRADKISITDPGFKKEKIYNKI